MLKIAVCDDEAYARKKVQQFLLQLQNEYNLRFDIKLFKSGENLCDYTEQLPLDLIYLDYMMKGMSGLEVAKKIRASGNSDIKIIFVSSYDGYVKELFPLEIVGFLDKPCEFDSFRRHFQTLYHSLFNTPNKVFTFNIKSEKKIAFIRDIVYFETGDHSTILHLREGSQVEFRCSFNDVWTEVKQYECFAMPTRSFIVNFKYAQSVSKTSITIMDNSIPIGRTHKKETEQRYMLYLETLNDGGTS